MITHNKLRYYINSVQTTAFPDVIDANVRGIIIY